MMKTYKEISSPNNDYIKELAKLKIKKYRDQSGLFLIEGYNLVEMAKNQITTILTTDISNITSYDNVNYIKVSNEVIEKLASTKTPQGIIGVCLIQKNTFNKEFLNNANKILILDNLQDPGNIGTLIRSALAFGFENIVMSLDCVDIYNDKVLRASQGSIFETNICYCDIYNVIKILKENNYTVYGTALNDAVNVENIVSRDKTALILGNEGNGIKKEILKQTDKNIYIPMSKKIDSLNVGVAGGIIMYYLSK